MKQSELLRKQADMLDMAEKYGIDDWRKLVKVAHPMRSGNFVTLEYDKLLDVHNYRFAIGVVEGKPVFEGDELWNVPNNFEFTACDIRKSHLGEWDFLVDEYGRGGWVKDCSWNPPKPKTVMVELPLEAAETIVRFNHSIHMTMFGVPVKTFAEACRKALEAL